MKKVSSGGREVEREREVEASGTTLEIKIIK